MSTETRTLARATDPETSHTAAAEAVPRTATIRERVGLILAAAGRGMTHDEIIGEYRRQASRLGWRPASDSGIRTRVRELVAAGEVERVRNDDGWSTCHGMSRYGRASIRWRAAIVQSSETAGGKSETEGGPAWA